MLQDHGNLALAEPPVRTAGVANRERGVARDEVHPTELAMLRERVKRMRMPRGECTSTVER